MKGKGKGSRSDSKAAVKKVRTTHSGDGKRTKQSKPTRKSPRAKATKKNTVASKSAHGKPRRVQQSSDVDEELECVSSHASQVDQRSCSSDEKKPVAKKNTRRKRKIEVPDDCSSSSSSSSGSDYSASSHSSSASFRPVYHSYNRLIRSSYKALDLKLWAGNINSSSRKIIFKSLNQQVKALVEKTHQLHRGEKVRKNFSWMESFDAWIEFGELNPDRKNRIPLDNSHLSSWVHEQRKAFKSNKLSEERRTLLEHNGFLFDARLAYGFYTTGLNAQGMHLQSMGIPPTVINHVSQTGSAFSQLVNNFPQLGITGRIVDADVKEASVGGALLESTGEEAVVNDEAAAGGSIAPLESTGEEAMINNEETVLDVAAAYSVSAALESIAPLESTGENAVVNDDAAAGGSIAPLESTGEEAVVNDEAAAAVSKEVCHEFTEEHTAAAVIKVTQEEHFVENVAFGSVAVEGFLLESTSETNTDSSAADERGNSIDTIATTNRSLRVRKNGKVVPKSDGEVIDLEAIQSSTIYESHCHLFIFPASMSGETKLNSIITSEFVDTASVWNRKICMFTNSSRNKCELLYSDFTWYKNKSFTTCNVMNGFFNLLSEHFVDKDAAFGTTFDGAVYKSGLKLPVKKLREVLKHRRVESVYLPLNVNDNHWILVVINWPGYRVDVYDSLDSKNEIVCGTFISLLRKCQKESDVNKWQAHNHYQENIQRQFDSYSCGYFTCWYAYQLVNNGTIGLFTDSYEVSVANIASKILISLIEASIVL